MKEGISAVLKIVAAVMAAGVLAAAANAQQLYQWSDWHGTSANSIQYRYKLAPYNGEIQFRNTNSKDVSISYAIWEPGADQAETGSSYIKGNDTDGGQNFSDGATGQAPERVDVRVR